MTEAELNRALLAKIAENTELRKLVTELRDAVVKLMALNALDVETVETA